MRRTFVVTGTSGFIGSRVALNLLARGEKVIFADRQAQIDRLHELADMRGELAPSLHDAIRKAPSYRVDVSSFHDVLKLFETHPDTTHLIHLAYLMSAEVEANQHLGARVNVVGMVNLLEAARVQKLQRVIFSSSETVYGASQDVYGNRPVTESDHCGLEDHHFTYGVMKLLNEFTARRYRDSMGVSTACVRPPIVYGDGRARGSVLWAGEFASAPARGDAVRLPFSKRSRDAWIYVDDCAEQIVRLAIQPELQHFAYNCGGHSVSAEELMATVASFLPDAQYSFDESVPRTPLVDALDGQRLEQEIDFRPRSLAEGVRAHINEARQRSGLALV